MIHSADEEEDEDMEDVEDEEKVPASLFVCLFVCLFVFKICDS